MFTFIIMILLGLVTLIAIGTAVLNKDARGPAVAVAAITGVLALVAGFFSMVYSQDPGEAKVQRSVSGQVVGVSVEDGWHVKAPWVSPLTWDVRNLLIEYAGGGDVAYTDGSVSGPQVTMQLGTGTSVNVDLSVLYSITPDDADDLYKQFGSQEAFTVVLQNDIRSISRNAPAGRDALSFVQDRAVVEQEIHDALNTEWEKYGVAVEAVNLQEIRLEEGVQASFNDVQTAENREQTAIAEQEIARANAETKRIEAEGVADANRTLSESLTPEILQQKYIDALHASGQVYVVPEGSQPIVPVQPQD